MGVVCVRWQLRQSEPGTTGCLGRMPGRLVQHSKCPCTVILGFMLTLMASGLAGWAQQTPGSGSVPASGSTASASTSSTSAAAPPTAAPAHVLNVRDFGAVGDGVTLDRAAIQKAVDSAHPGDAVYFPAGTYALDDSIKVLTSQLTFYGDGAASIISHGSHRGLDLGSSTEPLTGMVVEHLGFRGMPGQYMADNNFTPAIQIAGPQGAQVSDCDFQGGGFAVASVRATYGTQIANCRVNGWGVAALLCNGGELVSNCRLMQDDPNLAGGRSGPGIWISSNAANVQVADTFIQNARSDAVELYGTEPNNTISHVKFLRCTVQDCQEGFLFQPGLDETGEAKDVLIENCVLSGTYNGPAISLKGGDGVIIRNNQIADGKNAALALGRWGSSEWGFTVSNLQFENNTVRNCGSGVFALATSGGHLTDIRITNNSITSCKEGIAAISSFGGNFANMTISGNSFFDCTVNLDVSQAGPGITLAQ